MIWTEQHVLNVANNWLQGVASYHHLPRTSERLQSGRQRYEDYMRKAMCYPQADVIPQREFSPLAGVPAKTLRKMLRSSKALDAKVRKIAKLRERGVAQREIAKRLRLGYDYVKQARRSRPLDGAGTSVRTRHLEFLLGRRDKAAV